MSYSFCVIGTAGCKRRYVCHKCIDEFFVYQKACSPVSTGPCVQAQGAQPQYQGKWISRLKADYIQCTWRRSEHPNINAPGFIYKKLSYHPVKGHARSSTICAKGNGFLGSRPVISNAPGRGMSMPHKPQDRLSFAVSEHNDSRVSL